MLSTCLFWQMNARAGKATHGCGGIGCLRSVLFCVSVCMRVCVCVCVCVCVDVYVLLLWSWKKSTSAQTFCTKLYQVYEGNRKSVQNQLSLSSSADFSICSRARELVMVVVVVMVNFDLNFSFFFWHLNKFDRLTANQSTFVTSGLGTHLLRIQSADTNKRESTRLHCRGLFQVYFTFDYPWNQFHCCVIKKSSRVWFWYLKSIWNKKKRIAIIDCLLFLDDKMRKLKLFHLVKCFDLMTLDGHEDAYCNLAI